MSGDPRQTPAHQAIHATAVAMRGGGVLIQGPSGSGKSELALRLIERGATLIGDDYVHVFASGGALYAAPPVRLQGLLEVRGVGLARLCFRREGRLVLVADLVPGETIERMPKLGYKLLRGIWLPVVRVAPQTHAAPAKIEQALRLLGDARQ